MFRFVGRGLAPAVVLFGQSGTPVPTVRKTSVYQLTYPKRHRGAQYDKAPQLLKKRCGHDEIKPRNY